MMEGRDQRSPRTGGSQVSAPPRPGPQDAGLHAAALQGRGPRLRTRLPERTLRPHQETPPGDPSPRPHLQTTPRGPAPCVLT